MSKELPDLSGFDGSVQFFRHELSFQLGKQKLVYTEGVQYLAEQVGAYWLIDVVASHLPDIMNKEPDEHLFVWSLTLDGKGGCVVKCQRDTEEPVIVEQAIAYTDFPEDFQWFVGFDGAYHCMMLMSEY